MAFIYRIKNIENNVIRKLRETTKNIKDLDIEITTTNNRVETLEAPE